MLAGTAAEATGLGNRASRSLQKIAVGGAPVWLPGAPRVGPIRRPSKRSQEDPRVQKVATAWERNSPANTGTVWQGLGVRPQGLETEMGPLTFLGPSAAAPRLPT